MTKDKMTDTLLEKIIQSPLFLKLKDVVENNSYHDHEDVYSHVLKVKDIAKKDLAGDFITNPEAKEKFLKFTVEDIVGFRRSDIMILTALLHDIGKVLFVKERDITRPLLISDGAGKTSCPGHEYWGSTIIDEFTKDLSLPKEIVEYIAKIVRLHDTFGAEYFAGKENWPWDSLVNDVKSRAEGFYIEALFNVYCDCFNAIPFQLAKEMINKLFNEPRLYERREYVLP